MSVPRVLVTGGEGNLGAAVALLLAQRGWEVHVTVRGAPALPAELVTTGARAHAVDLTDGAAVERMARDVGAPLAAVVHTVGGFAAGKFAEMAPATFAQQTALNLATALLVLRHTHAALAANPGGAAAVLVANRPALSIGPGVAVTAALKAALVHLAGSLAEEWKPDGVRVNAIAPGIMDTPQNRASMPKADPAKWPTPAEVAETIAFLVSPESAIVSGGVVPVFGRS